MVKHSSALLLLFAAVLFAHVPTLHAGRSVLQDALSNSNGCLDTIPKCEPGACATRDVMGVARWVCLRCLSNYDPVVTGDGQDNIIQCVCPKGFYEADPTNSTCTRCPVNSYCFGGDRVESPLTRGYITTCGANLITRNTGSRTKADCVAPAGFALASAAGARPCNRSEYAPMYNRLAKCLKCQSGLEEPLNSGLTDGQRDSKRNVCMVPPGMYVSQGLVRICPQGFYRANYTAFSAPVSQLCLPCNPGITTDGPGAGNASLCIRVIPGYGLSQVLLVGGQVTVPSLPTPTPAGGLPNATQCAIGFYSSGGYCAQCPSVSVTRSMGAKSVEECVVPPGYMVNATSMSQCAPGFYREGWVMATDPKATACTACGTGILSEARDLDENPKVAAGSLTRATSASCYIEAGQGMIADGKNTFSGKDCPINTYGASGKVYGLVAAPCKPCPRNMITDLKMRVNSSDVCINDDGFGYASEGASRCAPGFFAIKGSRKPCKQCSTGRTTTNSTAQQRLVTDCFVKPGFGVVNSTLNSTDAFNFNATKLAAAQQALLPVLECPLGYYGLGNNVAGKCTPCPTGSTTQAPGSTNVSDCNVCIAGFGKASLDATFCSMCPPGQYQPGGLLYCLPCPNATFYAPVDGAGDQWSSAGLTTFLGAVGAESCVPKESQLSPEAGQAYFGKDPEVQALLTNSTKQTLGACLSSCPSNACCLAQYEVTNSTCRTATLAPVAADAAGYYKLLYKLPPSAMGSASSVKVDAAPAGGNSSEVVKGKMISSGIYARCNIPTIVVTDAWGNKDVQPASGWMKLGTALTADARTFSTSTDIWDTADWATSEDDCKKKCDDSNVCWGFVYYTKYNNCWYRGGEDALKTRSFFVVPTGVDITAFNWQGATALDLAVGNVMSMAASQGASLTKKEVTDMVNYVYAQYGYYDTVMAGMMLNLGS